MIQPFTRYVQLYECTDPADPLVASEISKGMRWSYGLTDIHDHLPLLRALATGNVLEIGTRFGASTAALLTGVEEKGGHVWSVDTDACDYANSLFNGHPQWTFLRADSRIDWLTIWDKIPSLDLLFVDGDHSYDGVLADLMNFGPVAKVIVAHDYDRWNNPQVVKAIVSYLKSRGCRHSKIRAYRESSGLAIIK